MAFNMDTIETRHPQLQESKAQLSDPGLDAVHVIHGSIKTQTACKHQLSIGVNEGDK